MKKDGTPKLSGGRRTGTGRPKKTVPDGVVPWPQQLERALRLAANNMFVVPKTKFFTKTEVKKIYGVAAAEEFGHYFESVRRFDLDKADAIRHRQAKGEFNTPPASWKQDAEKFYTSEKYADWLINNTCFSWMSVLKDEHHIDVWRRFADNGKIR